MSFKKFLTKQNQYYIIQLYCEVLSMKEIKPLVAWLTTNRTCNNKCKWCYTYNYKCSNLKMNNEKLKDTVDVCFRNSKNML